MSQLPFTRTEYATTVPSGEIVGAISSPDASLMRVKRAKRASGVGRTFLGIHDTAAARSPIAATVHGSHTAQPRGGGALTDDALEVGAVLENASSAKARSVAD